MRRLPVFLTSVLALGLSATLVSAPEAVASGQSATLYMLPQLAQPGSTPASAGRAHSAMWAKLKPARPGRKVVLQRKSGRRWVNVTTHRENRHGIVEFTAPYKVKRKIARYRVSAVRYKGLGRVNSASAATNAWGSPAFDEPFTGTQLPAGWATRNQTYGAVKQRTCSATDDSATRVADGTAQLSVFVDPARTATSCTYNDSKYAYRLNGMIGTQDGYSFTYGYAAARIKFQRDPGQHAGFWLQQASQADPSTEVDAIEWYGDKRNPDKEMSSQIHVTQLGNNGTKTTTSYPNTQGSHLTNTSRYGSDWAAKYHVFSVEWTPTKYVFRIDGKQTRTIIRYVSDQPEYLVLSLLSSDWELQKAEAGAPKQTMNVDWVRVWKMPTT